MSASLGEVCRFCVGLVFVVEMRLLSSLRTTPRGSLRAPFTEVFEIMGLGSSLGAGDGRTVAIVLDLVSCASRYPQVASAKLTFVPWRRAAMQISIYSCAGLGALGFLLPSSMTSA
jgi:hypothetical protein